MYPLRYIYSSKPNAHIKTIDIVSITDKVLKTYKLLLKYFLYPFKYVNTLTFFTFINNKINSAVNIHTEISKVIAISFFIASRYPEIVSGLTHTYQIKTCTATLIAAGSHINAIIFSLHK